MGCPHSLIGDPKWCSQCQGVKPRMCVRDETTGLLFIDGKPVDRQYQPPMIPRSAQVIQARKARRSRAPKTGPSR